MNHPILQQIAYQWRLYAGVRSASRIWSPEHDMARLPFPKLIQLQTINACQAACRMCPYPIMKNVFPRGRMDDALFDKLIAEIAAQPAVETFVPMLQNEPFLDKQLFDKVARFKALAAKRVRVVSREVYRRIRVGRDFDQVIAGVERAIAAKLPRTRVFVRLIRLRQNIGEVRASPSDGAPSASRSSSIRPTTGSARSRISRPSSRCPRGSCR